MIYLGKKIPPESQFFLFCLGDEIPAQGTVELMVLSAGQVILIFFIISIFFGTSLLIFLCELIFNKVKPNKTHKKKKKRKKRKEKMFQELQRKDKLPEDLLRYPNNYPVVYPNNSKYFFREIELQYS